jgi:hypothetical protein
MANSSLQGKHFTIPQNISEHLTKIFKAYKGAKNVEGYQRLEEFVNKTESKDDSKISYEQLKLIKNFFDSYTGNNKSTPYLLNGGTLMKNWVQKTLDNARQDIEGKEKSMKSVGMGDHYQKEKLNLNKIGGKEHDSDTNKILRQEGIYSLGILENLITIIDKNKKLCQMDNKSHLF